MSDTIFFLISLEGEMKYEYIIDLNGKYGSSRID